MVRKQLKLSLDSWKYCNTSSNVELVNQAIVSETWVVYVNHSVTCNDVDAEIRDFLIL